MKNVIAKTILFIAILSVIVSCSNDSDSSSGGGVLIKKISEKVYYSGQFDLTVSNFVYESNILKSISTGTYEAKFIYNGNKIMQVDNYYNNTFDQSTKFTYSGEDLQYTLSGDNEDEKTEYSYSGGILSAIKSGYLNGNNFTILNTDNFLFNASSNVSESITNFTNGGSNYSYKDIYTYDSKNHPMKDMNKYFRLVFSCEGFDGLSNNNVISRDSYSPVTSTIPQEYNYQIIYNSDNFPTEIKKYATANNDLISETSIEYQ
jgi:hypothetical protein